MKVINGCVWLWVSILIQAGQTWAMEAKVAKGTRPPKVARFWTPLSVKDILPRKDLRVQELAGAFSAMSASSDSFLSPSLLGIIDDYNHPPDHYRIKRAWRSPYVPENLENPDPYRGMVLEVRDTREKKSFEGLRLAVQVELSDEKNPTKKILQWQYIQAAPVDTFGDYRFIEKTCVELLGEGATPLTNEVAVFLIQLSGGEKFFPPPILKLDKFSYYVLSTRHPNSDGAFYLNSASGKVSSSLNCKISSYSYWRVLCSVPTGWN